MAVGAAAVGGSGTQVAGSAAVSLTTGADLLALGNAVASQTTAPLTPISPSVTGIKARGLTTRYGCDNLRRAGGRLFQRGRGGWSGRCRRRLDPVTDDRWHAMRG